MPETFDAHHHSLPAHGGEGGAHGHVAQLFDEPLTRAAAIAGVILESEARGEQAVLALTTAHWRLAAERLSDAGYPLAPRLRDGRLQVFDATATLERIMRNGRPDPARFDDVLGQSIRRCLSSGTPLRACGELVDLLAAQGEFRAVVALEQLWNDLARRHPFALHCLYSSVHFGHPRSQDALRQICRQHEGVHANPADELGEWLLREQVRAFGPM